MPTPLVVDCLDVVFPFLTRMFDLSLETGCFPDMWKQAEVRPRLKKPRAEVTFNNLRPITNLSLVSKLVERDVFSQTHDYLTLYELYPKAHSSYCEFHSTETALMRVMNDILLNMNRQQDTILVLLDLRAAFDKVDHAILLDRLHIYLASRGMRTPGSILTCTTDSNPYFSRWNIKEVWGKYGVPQWSCLGPLIVLYASKPFMIIERHRLPDVYPYADDTQLYRHLLQCQLQWGVISSSGEYAKMYCWHQRWDAIWQA